ncbi:MAG: hypothetical protein CMJ78_25325 [Planctomycetaceae bacterium]|nr:hypothetical protein [Planctomycetaceae bacterium]
MLVESGELFQTVRTRIDGANFWFEGLEMRGDPAMPRWLRESVEQGIAPAKLQRQDLTAAMRQAYAIEYMRRETASKTKKIEREDRVESRLRHALGHAGAVLNGFTEHRDGYRVTWKAAGRRHVSSVDRNDLTVQVAGICLNGEDRKFDLESLVGVIREGEQAHEIVEVGEGGMTEADYWRMHPGG